MKYLQLTFVLLIGLSMNACDGSAGPSKYKVTGKVTFDGAPVADGRITFRGESATANNYSGAISGGTYTLECAPGSYTVEILASRMTGKFVTTIEGKNEVGEMYIPEKYNEKSTLKKTVDKGPNEINFELTK